MKSKLKRFFESATKPAQMKWGSVICAVLVVALVIFPISEMPTSYLDAIYELLTCIGAVGIFAFFGGAVYSLFISISANGSRDVTLPLWKYFAFWAVCVCVAVVLVFAKAGL